MSMQNGCKSGLVRGFLLSLNSLLQVYLIANASFDLMPLAIKKLIVVILPNEFQFALRKLPVKYPKRWLRCHTSPGISFVRHFPQWGLGYYDEDLPGFSSKMLKCRDVS